MTAPSAGSTCGWQSANRTRRKWPYRSAHLEHVATQGVLRTAGHAASCGGGVRCSTLCAVLCRPAGGWCIIICAILEHFADSSIEMDTEWWDDLAREVDGNSSDEDDGFWNYCRVSSDCRSVKCQC
jgi:hypothetical protein